MFQSTPPAEARGDAARFPAVTTSVTFQSTPLPKRGETRGSQCVEQAFEVSIHSPRRSEGSPGVVNVLSRPLRFQSTPPAEARGDVVEVPASFCPRMGSIPAHAGETVTLHVRTRSDEVHPRACGGNRRTPQRLVVSLGPSPRMRGKHYKTLPSPVGLGSIPAHAGETSNPPAVSGNSWVHPRACGGNFST